MQGTGNVQIHDYSSGGNTSTPPGQQNAMNSHTRLLSVTLKYKCILYYRSIS